MHAESIGRAGPGAQSGVYAIQAEVGSREQAVFSFQAPCLGQRAGSQPSTSYGAEE